MKSGQWLVSGYVLNCNFIAAGCVVASVNFSMFHPTDLQSTLREENRSKACRYVQIKGWDITAFLWDISLRPWQQHVLLYKSGCYVIGLAITCPREWNHGISEAR